MSELIKEKQPKEEVSTAKEQSKDVNEKTTDKAPEVEALPKKRKKGTRQVHKGQVRIQSTYNNTIVTVTDINGATLGWASAGVLGFKGAKKSTPYAASQVVAAVVEKIAKHGIKELQVFVKGVGTGRDSAIRAFASHGYEISLIKDTTPVPHNGCRKPRPRRV